MARQIFKVWISFALNRIYISRILWTAIRPWKRYGRTLGNNTQIIKFKTVYPTRNFCLFSVLILKFCSNILSVHWEKQPQLRSTELINNFPSITWHDLRDEMAIFIMWGYTNISVCRSAVSQHSHNNHRRLYLCKWGFDVIGRTNVIWRFKWDPALLLAFT